MLSSASPPPHPPPQAKKKQSSTVVTGCSFLFALLHCLRNEKRTTPSSDSDSNPPHPFSYSLLRRATNSFSNILGHGGFGPVYSGTLPSSGKLIAVKLMNSITSSVGCQGEREYHNELFFAARLNSNLLVPAIGFSSDPKRRRFLLVYDLMKNGNLHDALFRRKYPELTLWKTRFSIILDVAKGIQYLHSCDPPIIHGDIKPSNILLDHSFSAKIADFGLARLKTFSPFEFRKEEFDSDETEIESVNTSFEEYETDMVGSVGGRMKKNGSVKDYVMNWIGKEVKEESSKNGELLGGNGSGKVEKSKSKKKMEWWESMEEGNGKGDLKKKEKRRPAREWWKEEYSKELANKNRKKKSGKDGDSWWKWERDRDDVDDNDAKKSSKNRSRKDRGSGDSWLSGSGELRRVNWNSYDSCNSGEIQKSGEISSTTSMRGTVFYVAPENGYSGNDITEKCDVYSFGVLLLVIVSGRRPLQMNDDGVHVSEFKRANLVSWARHCGRNGKLLELVDPCVEMLLGDDREQALLCIRVALICLMKSPNRRPSMKQVVRMLSGELKPPKLPHECSQTRFQFKNRKENL
ncbi:receptor-like serine/threonine-protein kinase At4g25390 [Vicia villosa]|uniref:receptor-like serine/threonine-protein kinase At4g25390 n=1 Tax=Vicia villosa TaxID=3911 RepID=UPI00273C1FB8|nr:receptor-like serine/threonine-protein kinase At4g25390 [Vicia villosa]